MGRATRISTRLERSASDSGTPCPLIRVNSVDVSLVLQTKPLSADLQAETLFEDRLCVVAAASSKWARSRKLDAAVLREGPWALVPTESDVGPFTTEPFRAAGLEPPQARVTSYSHILRLHLVATGRYLAILPTSVVRFKMARYRLVILPVRLEFRPRPVMLVPLKSRTKTPLINRFIALAKANALCSGRAFANEGLS